jgi:hypothetical protein
MINANTGFEETPRQRADRRERERVSRGDFANTTSHLPQESEQTTRPIQGYAPHYSLGEALAQEEALSGNAPRNHGGYQDGTTVKQGKQSHYPDRERRIATALQIGLEAQRAEVEKNVNASA